MVITTIIAFGWCFFTSWTFGVFVLSRTLFAHLLLFGAISGVVVEVITLQTLQRSFRRVVYHKMLAEGYFDAIFDGIKFIFYLFEYQL